MRVVLHAHSTAQRPRVSDLAFRQDSSAKLTADVTESGFGATFSERGLVPYVWMEPVYWPGLFPSRLQLLLLLLLIRRVLLLQLHRLLLHRAFIEDFLFLTSEGVLLLLRKALKGLLPRGPWLRLRLR